MAEVLQRDYPNKSHIVSERVDESTVETECGLEFVQPAGAIITFDTEKDTYTPPPPEGQCGNCPWEEV